MYGQQLEARGEARGELRGKVLGEAEALLKFLAARGFARAACANTVDEVFAD